MARRGPVFHAHFGPGGFQRRRQGPQQAQPPATPAAQLLHLVPILLLLVFTFLQMPSQPVRARPLIIFLHALLGTAPAQTAPKYL
jgi:hypothetical protein